MSEQKTPAASLINSESTVPKLPPKLIIEILARTHPISLYRSKCVCRSWYALIVNPIFINKRREIYYGLPPTPELTPDCCRETSFRLPISSLLRFRLISRSWMDELDDPKFVEEHLEYSRSNNPVLIIHLFKSLFKRVGLLKMEGHVRVIHHRKRDKVGAGLISFSDCDKVGAGLISFSDFSDGMQLAGSFNGIVCLTHKNKYSESMVALWNPAIRKWKPIELPQTQSWRHMSAGVGFDASTNDYKIVCVISMYFGSRVQVYSNNKGLWERRSEWRIPFSTVKRRNCEFVVKGFPYWIFLPDKELGEVGDSQVLVRVDPSTGFYKSFCIPDCDNAFVVNWKNQVASLIPSQDRFIINLYTLDENGDEWTKLYSVGIVVEVADDWKTLHIPQCMASGEVVMNMYRTLPTDVLTRFINIETGSVTVNSEIEKYDPLWFQSYSHVESLICPKGMVTIEQEGESHQKKVFEKSSGWLPKDFESVLIEYVEKGGINAEQVNEALVDEDVEAGIVETQSTSVIA